MRKRQIKILDNIYYWKIPHSRNKYSVQFNYDCGHSKVVEMNECELSNLKNQGVEVIYVK